MGKKSFDADVIIIGAGPAGLSAAIWCVELGLETIIFEKEAEPGGQLLRIFNPIKNYLGLETANGRELRDIFVRSYAKRKPAMRLSAEIAEMDPAARSIVTTSGDRFTARALIIATGVRRRKLNVPGEEMFQGKGIIESGTNEKEKARNKTVLIVGGGDAALENALILADFASKVYVAHRRSELTARAEFMEKASNHPKIEFRLETVVNAIKGGKQVETVELTNIKTGKIEELAAEIVLIRIGVQPNTDLLQGKIELDAKGYILVNSSCETSTLGVYAIGDAANPVAMTISTATGTGATAAKAVLASLYNAKAV
ncbi:MAG: FAD-dependent oxidoreductase [Pyrinomonadaceae bacterium]